MIDSVLNISIACKNNPEKEDESKIQKRRMKLQGLHGFQATKFFRESKISDYYGLDLRNRDGI